MKRSYDVIFLNTRYCFTRKQFPLALYDILACVKYMMFRIFTALIKKSKFYPTTGDDGPEGSRGIALLFL